ncbi:MAG: hypothetical protein QSU88_02925, partial [Candidatus Methanoperedens sp.]|nr:hypothetical protein [Candidatus Methanoperedens sp.]
MYRIEWAESAKIEKIDNGKTIKVSTDKNSLSLELNDEKTKVNLTIDGNRIDEFIVRMKNSRPYIFKNFMGKAAQANVKRSKFDIKSLKKEHKPGELLVKYSKTSKLSTNDFKDYYKSQNITLIKNYPKIGYHLIRVDERSEER